MPLLADISESMTLMFRRPRRVQFAALCYRVQKEKCSLEVLLLTSRDTGRWVIPKGWPMGDKPGFEVAAQEAFEEAGAIGVAQEDAFGHFDYDKGMADGMVVPCRVQVHVMHFSRQAEDYKEKGKRTLEWVSPKEAIARVQEPGLKDLIARFDHEFSSVK